MKTILNRRQKRFIQNEMKSKGKLVKVQRILRNRDFNRLAETLTEWGFVFDPKEAYESQVIVNGIESIIRSSVIVKKDDSWSIFISPTVFGVEICEIKIDRTLKGKGLGGEMLNFLLYKMREAGVSSVILYPIPIDREDWTSFSSNKDLLIKFYEKRGFEFDDSNVKMKMNWEKFEIYVKTNQVIENLDFERILNPRGRMSLMAA
jgi:ribosomal protein S18 acetylase RimI-like enzyme